MYSVAQIKHGLKTPKAMAREAARLTSSNGDGSFNVDGMDIFAEDWDNLVILDACRYDTFADVAAGQLSGTLSSRISRGSSTSEFVRGNFAGKRAHDTVYASANSWYARLRDEIGASVFKFVELNGEKYRDPGTQTFHPEPVTEDAKAVHDEYPDKRLIVHYVQPHTPFMGPTARQFFTQYGQATLSQLAKKPDITTARIRRAYEETLDVALPHVAELVEHVEGKTVVTADHGELLGERHWPIPVRGYGHHPGIYHEELVRVPWLQIPTDERKSVTSETPERDEFEVDEVDDRLRDLGYKV
ncbi:alkaline phosphatase family protein [Halorussus litoreus]|uniref:hypothetical protein n=1 Tax=Halorussus litoreus TaxID=1710536 RepID=UPI0013006B3E|nr:hypothetical protein [Halorussus litoreus]